MHLTANFHSEEFNCKDGTPVPKLYIGNMRVLAKNLQVLRDELDEPVHLNCAYRTPTHNKKVGGVANSQHLTCAAADITCKSKSPKELAAVIEELISAGKMTEGGIGIYAGFVHYDIRGTKARW